MPAWQFYLVIGMPVLTNAVGYTLVAIYFGRKCDALVERLDQKHALWAAGLREDCQRFEAKFQ